MLLPSLKFSANGLEVCGKEQVEAVFSHAKWGRTVPLSSASVVRNKAVLFMRRARVLGSSIFLICSKTSLGDENSFRVVGCLGACTGRENRAGKLLSPFAGLGSILELLELVW